MTGEFLAELFSTELVQDRNFLKSQKTIIQKRTFELQFIADMTRERLTIPSPEKGAIATERADAIQKALCTLNDRERMVVELRFGLGGERPKSLNQVADLLKVTTKRIRQIQWKALCLLRRDSRGLRKFSNELDDETAAIM